MDAKLRSRSIETSGSSIALNLSNTTSPTISNSSSMQNLPQFTIVDPKIKKFKQLLESESLDIEALRKLSWNGIPSEFRGIVWKILLGYLPVWRDRRESTSNRKRKEYKELCDRYYSNFETNELNSDWLNSASNQEKALIHQIKIDVPRTLPHHSLFSDLSVQRALERILLMWAFRHPASGYVQGINDLVTPFFVVFLEDIVRNNLDKYKIKTNKNNDVKDDESINNIDLQNTNSNNDQDSESGECYPPRNVKSKEQFMIDFSELPEEERLAVEADCYWCVTKFIDCIQDNYTFAQPGIQRMVSNLEEIVGRIDAPLLNHLHHLETHFIQFSFRWMNCLLMRELPLSVVIRTWDTYISEGDSFPSFHTYVCASILITFSEEIRSKDFQEAMIFLQNLPTNNWTVEVIEPLLSQAYIWQTYYKDSPSHLKLS